MNKKTIICKECGEEFVPPNDKIAILGLCKKCNNELMEYSRNTIKQIKDSLKL